MTVIKRDGKVEDLEPKKILNSIIKANENVKADEKLTSKQLKRITDSVVAFCETLEEPIDIDILEDVIEKKLMEASGYEVAKKYITYRYEKERVRNTKYLTEKLTASNVQNQNANVDEYSFGGRMGETASYVMKNYALEHLVSKKTRHNHNNNEVYIHDLDAYAVGSHNCAERNMWVKVKINNTPRTIRIGELGDIVGVGYNQLADTSNSDIYILSRDGWTKLINIVKRKTHVGEKLYTFNTRTGIPVKVTAYHRLPVIRDGHEVVLPAGEIVVGDSLLDIENVKLSGDELNENFLNLTSIDDSDADIRIVNLTPLRHYLRYRYDITLTDYMKSKGIPPNSDGRYGSSLRLSDFKMLCDEYPLSFDVLSQLQMKSCGSKHTYPLHIPFTSDLAKLYGYIYGDGGVYIRKDNSLYQLTFTNTNLSIMEDFIRCYENVFGYKLNISYPTWNGTSPCMRVTDGSLVACKIFKDFAGAKKSGAADMSIPDFIMNGSDEIKYAFLAAAIDTDGCVGDGSVTYTTCGKRYSEQMVLLLSGLGYHPSKVESKAKGTIYRVGKKSGIRNYDIYSVKMYRNDEISDLLSKMKSFKQSDKYAYKGLNHKFNENRIYSITTETGEFDVFDVETGSHWFILNNYVSHNCLSIPFDKLLATGFNTRQGDVRPAGSINTAMQLVAVIFQLQSLQQFGGVAATHLDWTMVPYVRKSFKKHFIDGLNWMVNDVCYSNDELKRIDDNTSITDQCWFDFNRPMVYEYAMRQTTKELEQAVEALFHNLNTLQSRSGNQLPFTSINYGTCTLPEGRMVIKALIEGSIKGIGKFHKTPIFPCSIFQCMKGVNRKKGDPNYDLFQLACKSTALRLYPNYANCDWSNDVAAFKQDRTSKQEIVDGLSNEDKQKLIERIEKNPELGDFLMLDVSDGKFNVKMERLPTEMMSTMGCRTYNGFDINSIESYRKNIRSVISNGTLYDDVFSGVVKDSRGNICPTTIILPTLAMQAKKKVESELKKSTAKGIDWAEGAEETRTVEYFMELLDKKIHEAKDSLLERFDWISSQPAASAKFMYENGTMGGYVKDEDIKSALRHGTIVIGQLGLAETLQILIGCNHTTKKGMELAKRIEKLYKDRCAEFKNEYHMNFGNYFTPAENLCYTAMKKFKAKYGEIEHVSDHDYFTNSIHIPVWEKMTPFEKIDLESQLTGYSSAGSMTYVELDGSAKNNLQAIEELVNYAMDKDIPYLGINIKLDTCDDCGYSDEIGSCCPKCGSTHIQRLRRVTGYLTGDYKTAFNYGKQKETEDRVEHTAIEV